MRLVCLNYIFVSDGKREIISCTLKIHFVPSTRIVEAMPL